MSHEDETTPAWKTEEAFERQPAGDGEAESSWEHLLSHWASPDRGAPAPPYPAAPAHVAQTWLTQPLDEVSAPPPLEAPPAAAVEPQVAAPEVAAPDVAPPPAAAGPGPVAPPAPPVEPSAAVVDMSTFELPPEPEPERNVLPEPEEEVAEAKVPFYKREISLKRKPKAAKPTRERKPKGERKPKRDRAPKEAAAAGKVPFYR